MLRVLVLGAFTQEGQKASGVFIAVSDLREAIEREEVEEEKE